MLEQTPFLLGASLIAAFLAFRVARVYSTLAVVEKVALWWWVTIGVIVVFLGGGSDAGYLAIGIAGVLMVGLGFFLVLTVGRIAFLAHDRWRSVP